MNTNIGLRLKKARESARISRADAARRAEMSRFSLIRMEEGQSSIPASALAQFAPIYKKPLEYFFFGDC
jgi:transcriptional regulator with XRE-family HTH domain